MKLRIGIAAIAVAAGCAFALPAAAQVRNLATSGAWTAYGGRADDGKKVCGVSAQGGGRWLGMKYFEGDSQLTVHLTNSKWTVSDGVRIAITAEFDDNGLWNATATSFHVSNGDAALGFSIPKRNVDAWIDEFRKSNYLYIRFPNDSVTDWQADLDGSDDILAPFVVCMAAILLAQ